MKYLFSLAMAITLLSCNAQQGDTKAGGSFTDVSNEQAKAMMAANSDLQIIDVRTDGEVAQGIIDGAVQIDISRPDFNKQLEEQLDKDKPVLVYCHSGGRSKRAQNMMKDMGFKEVHNLAHGYSGWK